MPVLAEYAAAAITLRLIGEYSHDEMRVAFLAALPNPTATVGGLILDVRRSVSIRSRPSEEVRSMSRWLAARAVHFQRRLALLATVGTTGYGMMRLGAAEAEVAGLTVRVFDDDADARAWLVEQQRLDDSWGSSD